MILVTGGAGFIGSNLVAGLEQLDADDLAICDRLGSGNKWRNLAKREVAALFPPDAIEQFLAERGRDIDIIYHLGAISATTEADADLIVANNFGLACRLWDWCARERKRFVYASTAATYGDGGAGFEDAASVEALARLKPMNAYGWSKHLFDRRVARILREEKPRPPQWVGLKFFNVYGPNEFHKAKQRSVALQIYESAAAGRPARLFRSHRPDCPDGGQARDFIWVGDCVSVLTWLYDHPGVNGLFNLGTGKARSFADLAQATFGAMRSAGNIEYVDMPAEMRDRYQYFTEAPMQRLRAAGYTAPFTSLEDGVARYVGDYLATSDPYR
jgi:ADP-L-glycero-D-manno-heptose 6-epimerase